jgi:hypothetical protein
MRDGASPVALRSIDSLAEIVGQANLFDQPESKPLLAAMHYADRVVRFKAAAAVAAALPQKPFAGQEAVVPLLADMLAQTGKPGMLVIAKDQNELNAMKEAMAKAGQTNVMGSIGVAGAGEASKLLAAVDAVIYSAALPKDQSDKIPLMLESPRLQPAARIVAEPSDLADPARLGAKIDAELKKANPLPLPPEQATQFALRAADLMGKLAISRGQVLDLSAAQPALLGALDDARPEIVKACGSVLAYMKGNEIQARLLARALDEKLAPELRIAMFKDLANNGRFFGTGLDAERLESLRKAAETEKAQDIRSAAGEAFGTFSKSPEQIKPLILNQTKG